jgi:hypothetical protein
MGVIGMIGHGIFRSSVPQLVAESCTLKTHLAQSLQGERLIKTSYEELNPTWEEQKLKLPVGFRQEAPTLALLDPRRCGEGFSSLTPSREGVPRQP